MNPTVGILEETETTQLYKKTLALNEPLLLGSVGQHELTEAAYWANAQLRKEISERKQTQEALQLAQAQLMDRAGQLEGLVVQRTSELTETNKQLEAFVYTIAHDLRAPLRSIQGFSEMLVAEAGDSMNSTSKDYVGRIHKSAQFMDALLRDLLDFSRVNQQHVELTLVKLETVVESVLSRLQTDIQKKNSRVDNAGPWPVVLAHEATLSQVLFNLVSNALTFVTPDVRPVVRLRAQKHGKFIRVWVEDNGVGIAFVNRVAKRAQKLNHHPDIDIRFNKVTLTLITHDEGGLTEKDFALARACDGVFATF